MSLLPIHPPPGHAARIEASLLQAGPALRARRALRGALREPAPPNLRLNRLRLAQQLVAQQPALHDPQIVEPSPQLREPAPWTGALHEVFPHVAGDDDAAARAQRFGADCPAPVGVLLEWAARQRERNAPKHGGQLTVWIGRRLWPYPRVLERAGLLGGSLFVDAPDANARLWSAELALRSEAVATVIADGAGFAMPATRRLQLIARQQRDTLMLLARPPRDQRQLSAAGARWRVGPCLISLPADEAAGVEDEHDARPRWKVELLRCKGVRPISLGSHGQPHLAWTLCWEAQAARARVVALDGDDDDRDSDAGGDDGTSQRHGTLGERIAAAS